LAAPSLSRSVALVMNVSNRYIGPMARPAQTATALLGALSVEPMTGYELRRVITEVLGHFWHESFGQIYPGLAALEADGLVRTTPGERAGSRRYELTDAGRARLADLLAEPPTPQLPRNGTLLRVFLGPAMPPGALAALLDATADAARERMAAYAGIRAAVLAETEHAAHIPYWLATVRAGELTAQAQLQWVTETRAALIGPASIRPS
jgi:DNA-binding PadR family transcriptional regulator